MKKMGLAKETYIYKTIFTILERDLRKRPTYETCKRDLHKRKILTLCERDLYTRPVWSLTGFLHVSISVTFLSKWPTEETYICQSDLHKRPTYGKETYERKRDQRMRNPFAKSAKKESCTCKRDIKRPTHVKATNKRDPRTKRDLQKRHAFA